MGTPTCLAIDGDHSLNAATDPLHPLDKTCFKLLGIDVGKHASKGIMRRNTVGQLQQLGQPVFFRFPKFLDAYPSVRSTDHPAHRNDADIPQLMMLGSFDPWVLHLSKNRFQVS